jgi:hypothetical protein
MGVKKIKLSHESVVGGSFDGTMDDIPNGTTYVKTENNFTDDEKTKLGLIGSTILTLADDASTGANTTPVNLTGMSFSYAANSKYIFDMNMFTQAAAASTGHGFQLDVSSAVTQIGMSFFNQLATSGTLSGGSSVADDTSLGVSSGVAGTGINFVNGKGILITGANSGTAQFRFRSETTAITTCKANSTIIVTKIA